MNKENINLLDEFNINRTLEKFQRLFETLCNKKEELTNRDEFYREEENFNITLIEATDKHCLDMYILYKNATNKRVSNRITEKINIYNIIKENKVNNPEDILVVIENEITNIKKTLEKIYVFYNDQIEHPLSLKDTLVANHNIEVLKRTIEKLSNCDKEQEFASYVSKITSIPNNNLSYSISYKLYNDMPYLIRIDIYEIDKKSYTETFDVVDFVIKKGCDVNKILEVLEERISYLVKNIFS